MVCPDLKLRLRHFLFQKACIVCLVCAGVCQPDRIVFDLVGVLLPVTEILNAADLTILKQLLRKDGADEQPEIAVAFVKEDAGKWRMTEGLSEHAVTMTVSAKPESELNLAWGYWDPNAENGSGKWIMEALGKHPADSSGKTQVTVEMPADARRMALEVWGYTDASGKLDVDTAELVSVTAQTK